MSDPTPVTERVVARLSSLLARSNHSRRGFLGRVALTGSALAVQPWGFLVNKVDAYDVVCGDAPECNQGWTAFCCTVSGSNACPPGSFAAGWWKADNSGFCCGAARYYIDCNATCGSDWKCRCAEGTCDRRRVACNQFRYGQCHQEIACYGPVVCRVVTCTPPWNWDPACTTSSATDNRTATHSAPCLGKGCDSDVERLYQAMGGSKGILGRKMAEEVPAAPRGYVTRYVNGAIFRWAKGVFEVHGSLWTRYDALGRQKSLLGFPTSNTRTAADGVGRYNTFQGGEIHWTKNSGAHEIHGTLLTKWKALHAGRGYLGYPTTDTRNASYGGGRYNDFERGTLYWRRGRGAWEVHGTLFTKWNQLGRERSDLGFPTTDTRSASREGGRYNEFDHGALYWRPGRGAWEVHGTLFTKWSQLGRERSDLGFPTTDTRTASDGVGRYNEFDGGLLYWRRGQGAWAVTGPIMTWWDAQGREASPVGYPISDVYRVGALWQCRFDAGTVTYDPSTAQITVNP